MCLEIENLLMLSRKKLTTFIWYQNTFTPPWNQQLLRAEGRPLKWPRPPPSSYPKPSLSSSLLNHTVMQKKTLHSPRFIHTFTLTITQLNLYTKNKVRLLLSIHSFLKLQSPLNYSEKENNTFTLIQCEQVIRPIEAFITVHWDHNEIFITKWNEP